MALKLGGDDFLFLPFQSIIGWIDPRHLIRHLARKGQLHKLLSSFFQLDMNRFMLLIHPIIKGLTCHHDRGNLQALLVEGNLLTDGHPLDGHGS